MERNSEIRPRRRAKYPTEQPMLPIRYQYDDENLRNLDNYWKYHQGNEIKTSNDRNERRQSHPAIDHRKIYHCSTNVPRTSRNHDEISSLSRMKYVVPQIHDDEFHINDVKNPYNLRLSRNQLLRKYVDNLNYAKNIAIVRKNNYVDDYEEANEVENSTFNENENEADERSEEVVDEERRENSKEFNEKDYEEGDANDEIDEESDIMERTIDKTRVQRKIRMDSLPRGQKISHTAVNPSRYHRGVKIAAGKTSERCCHVADDRKNLELPTDDEETEEPEVCENDESYFTRKLSRKTPPAPRQCEENDDWISGRKKSFQRYTEMPERSLLSDAHRQTRRPRTMRPELEKTSKSSSLQKETTICANIKCEHCGRQSAGQAGRTTSSRNAKCRLQDSRHYIGEPIGDEIYDVPKIVPTNRQTKSRRSKDSRLPIYESHDKSRTFNDDEAVEDEFGEIYETCRGKNSRQTTNLRRSSMRTGDRHDDKSNLKNNKRY